MSPEDPTDNNYRLTPEEIGGSMTVIQDTFRECRPFILKRAGNSEHIDKSDGSPVTETDVEVEKKIQAAMKHVFPNIPVYGEEGGYEDNLTGAFWLIDPIDGTKNFIEGTPTFTSMAVLIQGSEAVAMLIYNQSTDDVFTAEKDKGAYKNGKRLDLSVIPMPSHAFCKDRFASVLSGMLEPEGVVCEAGTSGGGFEFTLVAEGRVAARFSIQSRGYIHDYAPGALLVREAGGAIIPVKDDEYTYETRSFVACHPALEAAIRANLQSIRQLEQAV